MPYKKDCTNCFDHAALMERVHILADRYPFATLSYIGSSILDRAIPILHIGEGERRVLYVGAHHGMEWITSLVLVHFLEELCDLRCAVSEAVTNCIVHAYRGRDPESCFVYISVRLYDSREVSVEVSDNGCGIEDIERARTPMFTTGDPSERCGMGFLVMDNFTDSLTVHSRVGKGTRVLMRKKLAPSAKGDK